MLQSFNLTTLILAFLAIQGCTQTVEVSYGEIKHELRLMREDIIDLELDQLKKQYLGKEVTVLKSRYSGCGYQMGIANACSSGFGLKDTDITDSDFLEKNKEIDIKILLYLNYTLDFHQRYSSNFPDNSKETPNTEMLKDMIFINETTNQEECNSKYTNFARPLKS